MTSNYPEINEKITGLWKVVGNTPMLAIRYKYRGEERTIYAKSEQFNITGSIKDRIALYILKCAYENQKIKPGDIIVETTSGNTGISFAAIGRALGHKVKIVMPDWMSKERRDIVRSLGAEIIPVSREEGGFLGSIRKTEEIAANNPNIFLPRQFANDRNCGAHHHTTGTEIWWQMNDNGIIPDAFVAGVGTGGTIMGVGSFLKSMNPDVKLYPLEPAESPTLSTGHRVGKHRIQGISDEFIPAILKMDQLNEIITVHDGDSIILAQRLASELGLAVGISSGANFLGAVLAHNRLGRHAAVVTTFSDSNKKYLSTDLMHSEPILPGYLSPDVELLEYKVIKRACPVCFNPSLTGIEMTEEVKAYTEYLNTFKL